MSSKHIYKRLMPSLMATSFLILSACQGTSQDISSRTAKIGQKTEGQVLARAKTDAELQSYALDATTLPAFQKILAPTFKKISASTGSSWEKIFKIKNWYIGPAKVAVDKLVSPIAGTVNDDGNYIIQQTAGEVFVDKALFEKLNEADQASSLLREYLKSIYTIRNLSDNDLCLLMKEVFQVKECAKHSTAALSEEVEDVEITTSALVDNKKTETPVVKIRQKANPEEVLGAPDNAKIEKVAKYIESQSASVLNALTIIREMNANGFNTKIFDYKLTVDSAATATTAAGAKTTTESKESTSPAAAIKSEQAVIPVALYNTLLAQMQDASTRALKCAFPGIENKDAIDCKIEVKTLEPASHIGMAIKFDDKSIENISIFNVAAETVPYTKFVGEDAELAFFQVWSKKLENPAVGSKYRGTFLVAKKGIANSTEVLELQAIVSIPAVVTEVKQDAATKKTLCVGKSDVDGSFEKMAAIVSIHGKTVSSQIVELMKPAAPCY